MIAKARGNGLGKRVPSFYCQRIESYCYEALLWLGPSCLMPPLTSGYMKI